MNCVLSEAVLGQDETVASSIPALVEPSVLRWARETIGLTPVAAARKLQLPDTRVAEWETGSATPTIAQLRKAADVYKRPLAVFFLSMPPMDFDAMRDFRRHQGADVGSWSPELHGEYRRALTQRDNALELAEIEDEAPSTRWRIDNLPDGNERIAALARQTLLEVSPLGSPRNALTSYEHLNLWVAALEEAGVLVLATMGGGVSPREMRAFSLYFEQYPVVVVNGSDSARGRLFSLLHEYAHLLLHTSGLCDTITDTRAITPDRRLEAQCNSIAASILMPSGEVLRAPEVLARLNNAEAWNYESLRDAASAFGVSAEAFLRRLVTLDRVPMAFYQEHRKRFLSFYEDEEARSRPQGGGNWYRNAARDLGKGYVRRVADAHRRRVIDSYTAASFLNVKVGQIPGLAAAAALREPVI